MKVRSLSSRADDAQEDVPGTNLQEDDEAQLWGGGTLPPPYDPGFLSWLLEHSSILRQNVDAYVTNIAAFGHSFKATLDLTAEDAPLRVRVARRLETGERLSDEALARELETLAEESEFQRAKAKSFFDGCCPGSDFTTLRKDTRQDLEFLGNGYWEVLRNRNGEPGYVNHAPASSMRLLRADAPITVSTPVRLSDLSLEDRPIKRRMRRYVQVDKQNRRTYFKSFGDPRVVSAATGKVYATPEKFEAEEEAGTPVATEMIHLRIRVPGTPYGVPRWIGNLAGVLGTREMEEVNFAYFSNKSVPPLAIIVNGGHLTSEATKTIEEHIKQQVRGKGNFHKILLLEGSSKTGSRVQIEIRPLTDAILKDAVFLDYGKRNAEMMGQSMRLPKILRGDTEIMNRACYSADTEVLTDRGWLLHDAVEEADRIAQYDPETGAVVFAKPKGLYAAPYTGSMVAVQNRVTDLLITPDHKVCYTTPGRDRVRVGLAKDLLEKKRVTFPAAARLWAGESEAPTTFTLPKLDRCTAIAARHHERPVAWADWLQFVGYVVSDGGILATAGVSNSTYWTMIRATKSPTRERMAALVERLGWPTTVTERQDGTVVWTISHKCLWTWVRDNTGVYSENRRLPDEYTRLDPQSLEILFNAMIECDGSRDRRRGRDVVCAYYSASTQLIGQVQQIAMLLGYRATRMKGERCWRLGFGQKPKAQAYQKSIQQVPYSGTVYCFSTDTGFYVTRRNGRVAMQGNTAQAALHFAETQVFQPERLADDALLTRTFLWAIGVQLWEFQSNAPVTRDPATLSEMTSMLVRAGVLVPAEGREIAGDIFNREFPNISEDWAHKPIPITLAEVNALKRSADGTYVADGDESDTVSDNDDDDVDAAAGGSPTGGALPLVDQLIDSGKHPSITDARDRAFGGEQS